VLALCIHIGRRPRRWRVLRAVEECVCAAGRCALSLYVLHVLVGIVPAYALTDEARGPELSRPQVTLFWLAWCAVFFTAAWAWTARGRTGPFEAALRRVAP
ncbi:MAG: DUF418 domain-containing protein, partial [Planctomycetota bacterium]